MLAAARAGLQSALVAPTELLAEQHHANLQRWLAPLGIEPVLITGKLRKRERETRSQLVTSGEAAVVVGTHAVFQVGMTFARLALAVVDEQHRFGVQQRIALRDKGPAGLTPHQLVICLLYTSPSPRDS